MTGRHAEPPADSDQARHRAAHLLVDALTAAGDDLTAGNVDQDVLDTVIGDLVHTIGISFDRDGHVHVDVGPFVYASLNLLTWLVLTLADQAQVSTLDVITDLRQQVHDWEHEGQEQ